MKKTALTLFVFIASGAYVVYQYVSGTSVSAQLASSQTAQSTGQVTTPPPTTTSFTQPQSGAIASSQTAPQTSPKTTPAKQTQTQPTPTPTPTPTATPTPTPPPAPAPAPKPKGQYADGSYTGSVADAYYGNVQVKVTISGGKITAVDFLQYPNDRSTSRYINSQAMPLLQQEAIQAQSANVSGVSGATDTSMAFVQSLGDALVQAKNS